MSANSQRERIENWLTRNQASEVWQSARPMLKPLWHMGLSLMTDIRGKTIELRNEAWAAVKASPAYSTFQALDDAVAQMGGERIAKAPVSQPTSSVAGAIKVRSAHKTQSNGSPPEEYGVFNKRTPHGDAAELVLREIGEPMTGIDLAALVPEKGAVVGGEKPVANFTSTLSRDPRFRNFRKEGQYYWALAEWHLPQGNEAEPAGFEAMLDSASSFPSGEEGGDGHGPATT